MRIVRKPMKSVKAAEEMEEQVQDVEVAPEATDLLFETEDVAQLLADVTDSEVTADVDEETDAIVFNVEGNGEYVVEPEGDEEILEATRRPMRGKKSVKASKSFRRVSGSRKARKLR